MSSALRDSLDHCKQVVDKGLSHVKAACPETGKFSVPDLDAWQQVTADLAVSTAEIECAVNFLDDATAQGDLEQQLAETFAAEVLHNVKNRLGRAPSDYGLSTDDINGLSTEAAGNLLYLNR